MCVCMPPRLLLTSGVMWHDKDPTVKLALQLLYTYVATVVSIVSVDSLSIDVHHRNQPNKSKLDLYKLLINFALTVVLNRCA